METTPLEDFDENTIIEGLQEMVKLFIFASIIHGKFKNTVDECLTFLQKNEYSITSFIDLFDDNWYFFSTRLKIPKNRYAFPYVFIHTLDLKINEVANMLLLNEYSKIPIFLQLVDDATEFANEVFIAMCTFYSISRYNMNVDFFGDLQEGTLARRCREVFLLIFLTMISMYVKTTIYL